MTPVTSVDAPPRAVAVPRAAGALAEVEAERAALGGLLHDKVMQSLVAARFMAELKCAPEVRDAVREAMSEVAAAMWALRPRTAEGQLVSALSDLAERRTGVVVAVRSDGVPDRVDPAAATVAYRVVQAAVDACQGTTMDVRVEVRAATLTVSVCDDGVAYDAAAYEPGSDLTRWLARAGALGGSARVGDGTAGGTTLWLEIPNVLLAEGEK